jgi:hypothetical protein
MEEENFCRFAESSCGLWGKFAGRGEDVEGARLEAEEADLCMNCNAHQSAIEILGLRWLTFIVSKREDIAFSCFPPIGVLEPDMMRSESRQRRNELCRRSFSRGLVGLFLCALLKRQRCARVASLARTLPSVTVERGSLDLRS